MLDKPRNMLVYMLILGVFIFVSACTGTPVATETKEVVEATPITNITVHVTQIVATPLPVTPAPTASPTFAPVPTQYDPDDPLWADIYYPQPGCPASRLYIDDTAFVAAVNDKVRIYASQNVVLDPGMRKLELGEEMLIKDGPSCKDGFISWYVVIDRKEDTEIWGWVPEGNGEEYWLLPLK